MIKRRKALDIYESLYNEVFEGDNYIWNPEVVTEYIAVLIKENEFERAILAKKRFIKFMKT